MFGAAYTLWLYQRVIFGRSPTRWRRSPTGLRETLFLTLLALAVLALGLWPAPFLDMLHAPVEHLLTQCMSKL